MSDGAPPKPDAQKEAPPEEVKSVSVVSKSTPESGSSKMPDECLLSSMCCNESTCFMPPMDTSCLGMMSSSLSMCTYSKNSCCICKAHPAYTGMVDGRDDVICVSQATSSLVKPLCLTGEKSVFKSSSKQCCFSQRCAYPCDKDVVPGMGTCFVRCCLCGPCQFKPEICVKKSPLPGDAFGGYAVDIQKATYDDEYIIMACCCCLLSLYVPKTYKDAFGNEGNGICTCFDVDTKMSMLPQKEDGYEIFVQQMFDTKCVKPKTCIKCTNRQMFTLIKCAVPCDDDVPFSVACAGIKCMGGEVQGFKQPEFTQYLFKPIEKAEDMAGGAGPKANEMAR